MLWLCQTELVVQHVFTSTYHNEMTAYVGSTVHDVFIRTPEVSNIVKLQNEHHYPVDACDNRVEAKGGRSIIVLPPDRRLESMMMAVIIWGSKSVIGPGDYYKQP